MKRDIKRLVSECDICLVNKCETNPLAGLLQPIHILDQAWEEISIDFIEGLPLFQGANVISVVVDCLTKCEHFIALSHPYTNAGVAKVI